MSNSEYLAHSEPLFKALKLPKIEDVYKLKLMKFYYNLSYNILPSYFNYYLEVINNNICMTKHSHFPYTSTCRSTHHNTNRKHNIHHIHYTNTHNTSTFHGKKPLFLTTSATQQTFPQTPTHALQQT